MVLVVGAGDHGCGVLHDPGQQASVVCGSAA